MALHCHTPHYYKPGLFMNAVLEVRNHTIELDSLFRVSWDGKSSCLETRHGRSFQTHPSLLASLSFLLQQRTILLVDCQLGASLIQGLSAFLTRWTPASSQGTLHPSCLFNFSLFCVWPNDPVLGRHPVAMADRHPVVTTNTREKQ